MVGDFGMAHGIIPAYAGSTATRRRLPPGAPDHPRIRGEHGEPRVRPAAALGSSPHTRGARYSPGSCHPTPPDHPRIRGEHEGLGQWSRRDTGSSPHTRGARGGSLLLGGVGGIIPAYAGSTTATNVNSPTATDHPRIRGEHRLELGRRHDAVGSSPHTRGAPVTSLTSLVMRRDHPRIRGEHLTQARQAKSMSDHPRIRGEHGHLEVAVDPVQGSSPHTRGARLAAPGAAGGRGIIPAYAGSTATTRGPTLSREDHPRIRGEHQMTAHSSGAAAGSSPHTRGARSRPIRPGAPSGIIPAYAGSTTTAISSFEYA